ncbi:unnamed protein product [Leptosia nina]|uniref:Uncharacterized protein n=1 Tax=Leptosia nina TaxID=320188 RepID=A0AAV1JM37_9NEOP
MAPISRAKEINIKNILDRLAIEAKMPPCGSAHIPDVDVRVRPSAILLPVEKNKRESAANGAALERFMATRRRPGAVG